MITTSQGKTINRVGVLLGGWSHETNYSSHITVTRALLSLGLEVCEIDIRNEDFIDEIKRNHVDVAFLTTHGAYGEDGKLQGLLEIMDIPYVGPGVCASAIGMNKLASKLFFKGCGVNVAEFIYCPYGSSLNYTETVGMIGAPLVIKPTSAGASFGVTIVNDEENFYENLKRTSAEFGDLLIEQYIDGGLIEYSVGILDDDVQTFILPVCEIRPKDGFYNNDSKNDLRLASHIIPAPISQEQANEMQDIAINMHRMLGCTGMSRTDMIMSKKGIIYVLEVNTLPGLLPASIFPDECRHLGITYEKMLEMLIKSAFRKRPMEIPKLYDNLPQLPESNRPKI